MAIEGLVTSQGNWQSTTVPSIPGAETNVGFHVCFSVHDCVKSWSCDKYKGADNCDEWACRRVDKLLNATCSHVYTWTRQS